MTGTTPATFVLSRDPRAQRGQLRRLGIAVWLQVLVVGIQLTLTIILFSLEGMAGLITLGVVLLYLGVLWMYLRIYLAHRAMRNLRIILSAEGVTYASDAGAFTAAWPAVKRIRSRRGGRYLSVRVRGWGGPVSGFGLFGELVIPLDRRWITPPAIQEAVRHFSNGAVVMWH